MPITPSETVQINLQHFHEQHFGEAAIAAFEKHFFYPNQAASQWEASAYHESHLPDSNNTDYQYEEEDDDLGYYPDGVKRTLTDEQIAIFRHSELEAIRRAERKKHQDTLSTTTTSEKPASSSAPGQTGGALRNKKPKNRQKHQRKQEPKPDLRKRTWDIVQPGLDTLEYD